MIDKSGWLGQVKDCGRRVLERILPNFSEMRRLMSCSSPAGLEEDDPFRYVTPNHLQSSQIGTDSSHGDYAKLFECQAFYAGNGVRTSKYTMLTFLPKNLFQQFHRFANIYFVIVALMGCIPQLATSSKYLGLVPIAVILTVTAVKDAFEDYQRYRSDRKVNLAPCSVYKTSAGDSNGAYREQTWESIRPGDVIQLCCDDVVPADILFLNSSDVSGQCFVETSNLDGESNLKTKKIVQSMNNLKDFHPSVFRSILQCEKPHSDIYHFKGFLTHLNGEKENVDKDNLILRGCTIRNTDFVEGLVVYAGPETKTMLNNSDPRYKRSQLERVINWDILWCVLILLTMCLAGALGEALWSNSNVGYGFLSSYVSTNSFQSFLSFWTYVTVFQIMVPISLYITMELVKLGQVYFINRDIELYDPVTDRRMLCRALNINEELGQIQYVMSDKTGTLTENLMVFRRCAINGQDYGIRASTEDSRMAESNNVPAGELNTPDEAGSSSSSNTPKFYNRVNQKLIKICKHLRHGTHKTGKLENVYQFMINMALCNTVMVSTMDRRAVSAKLRRKTQLASIGQSGILPKSYEWDYHSKLEGTNNRRRSHDSLIVDREEEEATPDDQSVFDSSHSTTSFIEAKNTMSIPFETTTHVQRLLSERRMSSTDNSMVGADILDKTLATFKYPDAVTRRPPKIRFEPKHRRSVSASNPRFNHGRHPPKIPYQNRSLERVANENANFFTSTETYHSSHGGSLVPGSISSLHAMSVDVPPLPHYEAESPDELALVRAAALYRFTLIQKQAGVALIELPDGYQTSYRILDVLPFTSERRRMSIVVQEAGSPHIEVFSKGADSVMMPLISSRINAPHVLRKAQENINTYATRGLRTLVLAKKNLERSFYESWTKKWVELTRSMEDDEGLQMDSLCKEIEQGMQLLGVTGIEDRLQDGVPDTIESLRDAGVRVWVLTGDKRETAISVANACGLFTPNTDVIQLTNARDQEEANAVVRQILKSFPLEEAQNHHAWVMDTKSIGVVVDGGTLQFCINTQLEPEFLRLLQQCNVMLCCRVTPSQKATVVKLVKEKMNASVLSVGDGANDVGMIQAANVGVGIGGQEGMQAVMAADFAISRFRFLKRLLLVHGQWSYYRLSTMVLLMFFQNAVYVFCLFWLQFLNGFSTQLAIDPFYMMFYNILFTSLPPLVRSILDQNISAHLLLENASLYSTGLLNQLYQTNSFWWIILDSLWQSLIIVFVLAGLHHSAETGLYSFGTTVFSAIILCNFGTVLLETNRWDVLTVGSVMLSGLIYLVFIFLFDLIDVESINQFSYMVTEHAVRLRQNWFLLFLVVSIALLPRFIFKVFRNTFCPSAVSRARYHGRLEEKHRRHSNVVTPISPVTVSDRSPVSLDQEHSLYNNCEDTRF